MRSLLMLALLLPGILCPGGDASAAQDRPFITLASTTSTANSGLFAAVLPRFTAAEGIDVRVLALGTGQAIRLARNGDADVLLVHHAPSERTFVRDGFGRMRHRLMYNDFVLVGPGHDPATAGAASDILAALRRLAADGHPFVSRGDDSGTHKRERDLWHDAGIDAADLARAGAAGRYLETGSGMGATLNIAAAVNGYTLSDRASWLSFANKGDLRILLEGDRRLFNQYGLIAVNPDRHPHVKADLAARLVSWLLSKEGQQAIADYRPGGVPLFHPNGRTMATDNTASGAVATQ